MGLGIHLALLLSSGPLRMIDTAVEEKVEREMQRESVGEGQGEAGQWHLPPERHLSHRCHQLLLLTE